MVHLLFALPIFVFLPALLGIVFFFELLVGLFCRVLRWLAWLPALAGALGLALMVFMGLALPRAVIFLFWGLFALAALAGWGFSRILKWLYHIIRS